MSKLVALVAAGVGAAGITAGGYYLVKNGSHTGNAQETDKITQKEDSLEKFKNEKGGDCAKSIFTSEVINFGDGSSAADTLPDNKDEFFGTAGADANKTKSCLIIDWKKNTGSESNSKWSGTFTWIWAFVNDKKGFINFNEAKTTTSKKLNVKGGFYLLEKGDSDNDWKVKYKKEVTTGKEIEKTDFENHFPKSNLDNTNQNENYWGFMENSGAMDNICESEESCSTSGSASPKSQQFKWTFRTTGTKKVGEWSANLKWWEHIYKGDENTFDLTSKLDSFAGTWTKEGAAS